MVPIVVSIMCIIGFVLAFKMPKDYTPVEVAKELKKQNPALDISNVTNDVVDGDSRTEIVFVQVALAILSGFIFSFIWIPTLLKTIKSMKTKVNVALYSLIAIFIPFASIYTTLKTHEELQQLASEKAIKLTGKKWLYIVLGIVFPILPINIIGLSIMQHDVNKLLG